MPTAECQTGFPSFLRARSFAFEMGVCTNLIFTDSVPTWALCGGLFKPPLNTASAFSEWHHCEYPINGCWVCDYRLPLCSVWLWGEIYDPARLLNEQIDRFVFDIVRCILEHPTAPLFRVQHWDRQFFIVARRGATLAGETSLCGFFSFLFFFTQANEHTWRFCWDWYEQPFFYHDIINQYWQAHHEPWHIFPRTDGEKKAHIWVFLNDASPLGVHIRLGSKWKYDGSKAWYELAVSC